MFQRNWPRLMLDSCLAFVLWVWVVAPCEAQIGTPAQIQIQPGPEPQTVCIQNLRPVNIPCVPIGYIHGSRGAFEVIRPSQTERGGVYYAVAPADQFMVGINADGVAQFAQPTLSNLAPGAQNLFVMTPDGAAGPPTYRAPVSADFPASLTFVTPTLSGLTLADEVEADSLTVPSAVAPSPPAAGKVRLIVTKSGGLCALKAQDSAGNTYTIVDNMAGCP